MVAGPRQVGKTTACRSIADGYLNWDNSDDRRLLLRGPASLADRLQLDQLRARPPIVVLDELHKYSKWKTLLKGFFDTYGDRARIVVTGSSRLDVFRRGGDSLMGRYLLYHMHPWSVAESVRTALPAREIQSPAEIAGPDWDALWTHGGFPEPFLRRDSRFTRRWRSLRQEQLAREDLRDLARSHGPRDDGDVDGAARGAHRPGARIREPGPARSRCRWTPSSAGWTCSPACTTGSSSDRGSRTSRSPCARSPSGSCATGAAWRTRVRGQRRSSRATCSRRSKAGPISGSATSSLRYLRDKTETRGGLPRRARPQAVVPGRSEAR